MNDKELPPICGMTEREIEDVLSKAWQEAYRAFYETGEGVFKVMARHIHRLAQPVVDPDKEAKRFAWVQYSTEWPANLRTYQSADELWKYKRNDWRDSWRAVAKAKEAADE